MKFCLVVVAFLASVASAVAADSTERGISLPDAYPACMERDGPNCIRKELVNQLPSPEAPNQNVILSSPPTGDGASKFGDVVPRDRPPVSRIPNSPMQSR